MPHLEELELPYNALFDFVPLVYENISGFTNLKLIYRECMTVSSEYNIKLNERFYSKYAKSLESLSNAYLAFCQLHNKNEYCQWEIGLEIKPSFYNFGADSQYKDLYFQNKTSLFRINQENYKLYDLDQGLRRLKYLKLTSKSFCILSFPKNNNERVLIYHKL